MCLVGANVKLPKEDKRIVGSVFKGKIQNLEDGLQAAFVDIGLKKNAFIHYGFFYMDSAYNWIDSSILFLNGIFL